MRWLKMIALLLLALASQPPLAQAVPPPDNRDIMVVCNVVVLVFPGPNFYLLRTSRVNGSPPEHGHWQLWRQRPGAADHCYVRDVETGDFGVGVWRLTLYPYSMQDGNESMIRSMFPGVSLFSVQGIPGPMVCQGNAIPTVGSLECNDTPRGPARVQAPQAAYKGWRPLGVPDGQLNRGLLPAYPTPGAFGQNPLGGLRGWVPDGGGAFGGYPETPLQVAVNGALVSGGIVILVGAYYTAQAVAVVGTACAAVPGRCLAVVDAATKQAYRLIPAAAAAGAVLLTPTATLPLGPLRLPPSGPGLPVLPGTRPPGLLLPLLQ